MTEHARTRFLAGLRITSDHMQHLQDRLREGILDLRRALGLGRVGWGLRVTVDAGQVRVEPGVAFSPSGLRLALDTAAEMPLPAGAGPFRVDLTAANADREALRLEDEPTLITLATAAAVVAADVPPVDADGLTVATIADGEASQDPALFVATGHHKHTGEFFQSEDGSWRFDGPSLDVATIAGTPGERGEKGDQGAKGDRGDKGDQGDRGERGEKGDKGDPGERGEPGLKGDRGDAGDRGERGLQGIPGLPGAGLDLRPGFVREVSWKHGVRVAFNQAAAIVSELKCSLDRSLDPILVQTQPQVLEVWFAPERPPAGSSGLGLVVVPGKVDLTPQRINFRPASSSQELARLFRSGGRLIIRVHVGTLFDGERTPFSAAPDALTGVESRLRLPGGVLESWLII